MTALSAAEQAAQLPIYACADEIRETLQRHQVIVVEGPTGSGKTTQIPRILRRAFPEQRIGITQPRRIAAVSVAWRISEEEGKALGDEVGYAIRFDDQTSRRTRIKLMTDGILLTEARRDPSLEDYGILMIDEAHERSLNIDVILGLIHQLLPERPDLRVIVSSATLYPEQFQRFFAPVAGDVPVISVPGRTYPIEIHYRPPRYAAELPEAVVDQILDIHRHEEPGAILVFLSGAGDIRRTERELYQAWGNADLAVLPLYARLSREEQLRVFDEFSDRRKIVLATNIAETSITIPDVRYVVDTGLAKVPLYSTRTGITTLREELISRASAEQRAGRSGRTGPGMVWRLYSKDSMADRRELPEEEIRRQELSEVVLRLIDLGVRDVEGFPFPTPPPRAKVRAAVDTLRALGAIDQDRYLTSIGQRMVPFPLSPSLARMVIEAADRFPSVVDEVLVVGAFLSARSPFVLPEGEFETARRAHRQFAHPLGDAVTRVDLFRAWTRARRKETFCERLFLDQETMEFAEKAHGQLVEIAEEQGIRVAGGGRPEEIVRAVAAGLADRIICRRGHAYETLTGATVGLHPGSVLRDDPPYLGVAAELVSFARPYAIDVSVIERAWLPEINPEAERAFGLRPTRASRRPVAKEAVPLCLGPLTLLVSQQRGKPQVELSLDQVASLQDLRIEELPPESRKVRAQVRWNDRVAFAALPVRKLVGLLPLRPFPPPGASPPADLPYGELWEVDRDRYRIAKSFPMVLRPAVNGRRAGFVAFVANGAGGYWLDLVPHYRDALQASLVSAEALVEELIVGDELRDEVQAWTEELKAKALQIEG